ncbi:hypothetical protein [Streptomyces sp. NBC_01614]|uniref:hypothetical protein n=1 Tax=Streptomyces sp. NBC_01614 TaxID=2975897 RepID=UPI00386E49A1
MPPLLMGSLYDAYGWYALVPALLAVVAAAALVLTATGVRRAVSHRAPAVAPH